MTEQQRYEISIVLIDANHQRLKPDFKTPLVNSLKPNDEIVNVDLHFDRDQLTIVRNDQSSIPFRRPSYCPFTNLYLQENSSLISDHPSQSIAVGVVILFESQDQHILLTRRAKHMRTFPSCWVCPGGGIEKGESLFQAGIRELDEEVGIKINADEAEQLQILALWESAFPVNLEHGLPRRHHVVIYLHIRSARPKVDLKIEIDPNEVDAFTWLSYEQIAILAQKSTINEHLRHFHAHVHPTGLSELPFDSLATVDHSRSENLTNGTRFALEQWFLSKSAST